MRVREETERLRTKLADFFSVLLKERLFKQLVSPIHIVSEMNVAVLVDDSGSVGDVDWKGFLKPNNCTFPAGNNLSYPVQPPSLFFPT